MTQGGWFSSNLMHPLQDCFNNLILSATASGSSGNQTPGCVPPLSTASTNAAMQDLNVSAWSYNFGTAMQLQCQYACHKVLARMPSLLHGVKC